MATNPPSVSIAKDQVDSDPMEVDGMSDAVPQIVNVEAWEE